jgi:glutathione synthase/RimK-type ligase-like ATP-grasp enzyme
MNHPVANARAGNKLFQLSLAARLGLRVPKTLVTRSLEEAQDFWTAHDGKIVVKPLSVGHVETRDGAIEGQILTSAVHAEHLRDPALLARCPTLLQQRVEKGVDIRVTVVDRQICALSASTPPGTAAPLDIRQDGMSALVYESVTLPAEVVEMLLYLCEHMQLRFAAIDLVRSRNDEWFFLEVNPNGQWAWLDLVGAADIARLFVRTFGAVNE